MSNRFTVLPALSACFALAVTGCGDDALPGADASPVDAGPDATDPLRQLEPTEPAVLSVGNDLGQDEDPAIAVGPNGALHAAWYSDRNGTAASGRPDREIFATRTSDGASFETPIQITRTDEFAFYPSLAVDDVGAVHLVYWELQPLPPGCTLGLDCNGGTSNRIMYNTSSDGVTWDLDAAMPLAEGPGDWLPSIVYDRASDRLLVYFAAVVRAPDGTPQTFGQTDNRIYVAIRDNTGWNAPVGVTGVHTDDSHNTYPYAVIAADGTVAMTWTRYDDTASGDVLAVISEPSTQTMAATSTDGVSFTGASALSGPGIDAFPSVYVDHAGVTPRATWLAAGSGVAEPVEMSITGSYPTDLIARPEIGGYTARVVATRTPGLFWALWVADDDPMQKVYHRFFER